MGFFSDFIFGSGSSAEFRTMELLLPEQRAALQKLLPQLTSRELPQTAMQSLQGLEELALARSSGRFGTEEGDTALREVLSGEAEDFDEFFDKAVRDPLLEDFRELIQPGIERKFSTPSGFWSSERVGAETQARDDLFKHLSRARAETGFQAREAAKGRQVQGLTLQAALIEQIPELLAARFGVDDARIKSLLEALKIQGLENVGVAKQGKSGILGPMLAAVIGTALGGPVGGAAATAAAKKASV